MKLKEILKGQKFKPWFSDITFILLKKTKELIEFENIKTGELHKSTTNDSTNYFLI